MFVANYSQLKIHSQAFSELSKTPKAANWLVELAERQLVNGP